MSSWRKYLSKPLLRLLIEVSHFTSSLCVNFYLPGERLSLEKPLISRWTQDQEAVLANHKKASEAGPFVAMALIFDRNNKVSLVCILIDLEMASSENPTINLDPIHSKGGSLGGKPSIRGRRDVVTATNRPARSKWKFVAVLFAITMAFSVIVAALLSGKYHLDYFGDTSNKCKCWFLVFLKGKGVFEWWKSCGQNFFAPMSYFHFRRKVNASVISFPYQFKVRDCRWITYRVRKTNRAKYDDLQHAGLV